MVTNTVDLKRSAFGFVEQVKNDHVVGWALDRSQAPAAVSLFLFIDDERVSQVETGIERQDVAYNFPGFPNTGFAAHIPDRFYDGKSHSIVVRFVNSGIYLAIHTDEGSLLTALKVLLPRRPVLLSHVEGLSGGSLRGWALVETLGQSTRTGNQAILVRCNGNDIATIKADVYRPDVGRVVNGDDYCGFSFVPPPRFRDGGRYEFEFLLAGTPLILTNSPCSFEYPEAVPDTRLARLFNAVEDASIELFRLKRELIDVMTSTVFTLDAYDTWARQYQANLRARRRASQWPSAVPRPLVSVICPVYRPLLHDFRAAVDSVLNQTWRELELILVDDASNSEELSAVLQDYAASDPRVRLIVLAENQGIAGATNIAIEAASGEYTALFDHDDLLLDVAVEVMMDAARLSRGTMLYSDEDKIDVFGRFSDPNLKPAWNYRLLLGQNYVCHFLVVKTDTLRTAGKLSKKYDGAQDHDLVLRLSEIIPPEAIVHVPEVIYHWRKTPGSTATAISAKSYAVKAGANAIKDHLARRSLKAKVSPMLGVTVYRIDWSFKQQPSVTVVIPFKDQAEMTARCLDALLTTTIYGALSVILVDNWSTSIEAEHFTAEAALHPNVTVLRVEEPFNFSRLNNLACAQSDAEFFVFMNNDVVVTQPNWLRAMVDEALADPTVGAVGARLLYPGGTTQHAGVILGVDGVGDHAFRGRPPGDPYYMGRGICTQEVSAVTAALMLCRAEAFRKVGGFDEAELAVAYNDVDLCLKLRHAGYRIIQCQSVLADHHESISRGDDMHPTRVSRFLYEQGVILDRWPDEIANDPFYNPNFSRDGGIFSMLSNSAAQSQTSINLRFRNDRRSKARMADQVS